MKHGRKLQIDVLGPVENQNDIIECRLIVDGRWYIFYTSRANYEALISDGLFIRNGKERDSANVLNTTRVFQELL